MKPRGPRGPVPWHRGMVFACLLAALATPCPGGEPAPVPFDPRGVDGSRILREVEAFVALGPRDSGTEGSRRAADYLADRIRKGGGEPEIDLFTNSTPRGAVVFRNVMVRRPGRGAGRIVLGAHYDTKAGIDPGFAGANDSGSGVGLLLVLADLFRSGRAAGPEILIAFLDGEECWRRYAADDGLHGSRRLASRLVESGMARDVRGVIIVDMVGDRNLAVTVPRDSSPPLISLVFKAAARQGVRETFRLAPGRITDDHVPFLEAGMPAVDLIDFQYGTEEDPNRYWHTAEDTTDKLSAASLETVGRVVVQAVNFLHEGVFGH